MDDTTDKYCNYKTTDCTVNTKDLYKGLNLPKRFECPCKYIYGIYHIRVFIMSNLWIFRGISYGCMENIKQYKL
jgi:hypothetical protein